MLLSLGENPQGLTPLPATIAPGIIDLPGVAYSGEQQPASKRMPTLIKRSDLACSLAFVAILCVALLLRFDTSKRIYYLDGILVMSAVEVMVEQDHWDSNWKHFRAREIARNPELADRMVALNPALASEIDEDQYNLAGYITFAAAVVKSASALGLDIHPNTLVRFSSLLFELLTLCLIFVIGKRHLGNSAALLATGIYSILPLTVQAGHYIRPEAMLAFIYTLLLYFALKLPEKPRISLAALAFLTGIAFACKYSQIAIAMVPVIAVVHFYLQRSQGRLAPALLQAGKQLPLATVFFLLGVFLFAPYIFLNFSGYLEGMPSVLNAYRNPVPPNRLADYTYWGQALYYGRYFLQTFGALILLLFLAGMSNLHKQHRLLALLTLSPIMVYFLFFCSTAAFFERSFNPVMPYFCLIAGAGGSVLFSLLQRPGIGQAKIARYMLICLGLVAASYTPTRLSYHMVVDYMGEGRGEERLAYQRTLLQEFPGYWIKNVDPSSNFLGEIPEVPKKNPRRIYVITDYHDVWTKRYLKQLEDAGYLTVGEYRSPFYGLVPNNLTIAHQAGRYVYLRHPAH